MYHAHSQGRALDYFAGTARPYSDERPKRAKYWYAASAISLMARCPARSSSRYVVITHRINGRLGTKMMPESFLTASSSPGLLAMVRSPGRSLGILLSLGVERSLKKSAVSSLSKSL